jgi:hypothetical protein
MNRRERKKRGTDEDPGLRPLYIGSEPEKG